MTHDDPLVTQGRMSAQSLTQSTSSKLRELALSVPEGQFLGTEKDLLERFGVSRPTLRQAIQLIEAERLIASVRGLNGGLFSRRPDLDGVIASAVTYLRFRETKLGDVLQAANSALAEAGGLAAECSDPVLRRELAALIEELSFGEHAEESIEAFRDAENRALDLICRMSANPALTLAVRLFYGMGVPSFALIFQGRSDLMAYRRSARLRILRAILEGDRAAALALGRRHTDISHERLAPLLLGRLMKTIAPDDWID